MKRQSLRFGLVGVAVVLLALLAGSDVRAATSVSANALAAAFNPDLGRIGVAAAFAFVCFILIGAYDERPVDSED